MSQSTLPRRPFPRRATLLVPALTLLAACTTGSASQPPDGTDTGTGGTGTSGASAKGGSAGTASAGTTGAGATGGASTTGKGGSGATSGSAGSSSGGASGKGGSGAGPGAGGSGPHSCPPTSFGGLPTCSQSGKAACITCACNDLSQTTLCAAKYGACQADADCARTVECILDGCTVDQCQGLVNNSLQKLLDLEPCFQDTCATPCAGFVPGSAGGAPGAGGTSSAGGTGTAGTSGSTGGTGTAGTGAGGMGVCAPNSFYCSGQSLEKCATDGGSYNKVMDCASGTTCDASSGTCAAGSGCGMAWEITYSTSGTFSITDTTFGAGDAQKAIGPGTIKVLFEDKGGTPGGKARVLSYDMTMMFTVASAGVTVVTNVEAKVPYDPCGHASGMLTGSNVSWDTCTYGPTWNTGKGNWHGDANAATGPGCLNDYTSAGNVNCSGSFCSAGNLKTGDNPQMGTWNQPLNGFEYAADFKSFKMNMLNAPSATASYNKGVETPNAQPSRTWIAFNATETARTQIAAPCSCP